MAQVKKAIRPSKSDEVIEVTGVSENGIESVEILENPAEDSAIETDTPEIVNEETTNVEEFKNGGIVKASDGSELTDEYRNKALRRAQILTDTHFADTLGNIFGQYYDANSWLHRLDPRTKLLSLLFLVITLFIINNVYVLLGFTALLLILILTTKTPFNKFLKSINMMTYILIFTFIMQILTIHKGEVLADYNFTLTFLNLGIIILVLALWFILSKYVKSFKLPIFIMLVFGAFVVQYYLTISPIIINYNIKIYEEGLIEASLITLRIICFLFLSSLLTLTTKPTEINCGLDSLLKPLRNLGINTGAFSMMISVTLRFIPTLILEADKVLKSQASRGADFKEVNFIDNLMVDILPYSLTKISGSKVADSELDKYRATFLTNILK